MTLVRRAVYLYVGACCAVAAAAAAAVVATGESHAHHGLWLAPVLGLVLLFECARDVRFRHRGEQGQSITHDESFFVAAVFLVQPSGIVLALALAMLLADTAFRRPPIKLIFNLAKSVAASSIALLLMGALGEVGTFSAHGVATAAVGGLVFVVLTDVSVSVVIALAARERLSSILLDDPSGRTVVWAGNIAGGLLAGIAAAHDLRLLPVALVAMVALHFALWGHARARGERDRSQERERLLQAILDSEPHCVMLVKADGTLGFVNPAGVEMFGAADAAQLIGRPWTDLATRDSRGTIDGLLAVALSGAADRREIAIERGGERRTLESTVSPVADEYDDIVSLVVVARDITVQRRLESQLRQAQKMEAVGQLAGGIAHDFNNLLTAIGGYSELALAQLDAGSGPYADVEEIRRAATRAAGLTSQLLAFSRRELLRPSVFDLNSTVVDVESLLGRVLGEQIQIATSLDPSGCPIVADPTQLEQVFMNLALNARDAMPDGGTLRIATDNVGTRVRVWISDTGLGMDAETRGRIFEPFFTTKEPGKGTGLGLAMVFGIVEESGGTIEVESEPGVGTRFVLVFPRAAEPGQESGSKVAGGASGIGPRSHRTSSSSTAPRAAASPST
jgi:PAS domain S-box-containing protein